MAVIDLAPPRPRKRRSPGLPLAMALPFVGTIVVGQLILGDAPPAAAPQPAPATAPATAQATVSAAPSAPAPTTAATADAQPYDLAGRPTRITDGDTLRLGAQRIRLHGIDAPEMSTPDGEPARRHLARLVGSSPIRCRDTGERSYDRIVAQCWAADGRDLAAAMVEDGWAHDWPRFSGGRYAEAQASAAANHRGLHGG